jgi:putative heme degradation protein
MDDGCYIACPIALVKCDFAREAEGIAERRVKAKYPDCDVEVRLTKINRTYKTSVWSKGYPNFFRKGLLMDNAKPYVRHQDFRIFNDIYTLSLTEQAFMTVMRACQQSGLAVTVAAGNGYAVAFVTDNIRVSGFGNYFMLTMNEDGLKALYDVADKSSNMHIQKLAENIDNAFEKMEEFKKDTE